MYKLKNILDLPVGNVFKYNITLSLLIVFDILNFNFKVKIKMGWDEEWKVKKIFIYLVMNLIINCIPFGSAYANTIKIFHLKVNSNIPIS